MRSAMILAAGRGERMRPLSDNLPKVLLSIKNKPLLFHHLDKLSQIDIQRVVINIAYLSEKIVDAIDRAKNMWPMEIHLLEEKPHALETAGGIINALPLLGNKPFLVISGDIYSDYPLDALLKKSLNPGEAHLVFVNNPEEHPKGDFELDKNRVKESGPNNLSYGNIGVFHPDIFAYREPGFLKLKPIFDELIKAKKLSGEHYSGLWFNIGTPAILEAVNTFIKD